MLSRAPAIYLVPWSILKEWCLSINFWAQSLMAHHGVTQKHPWTLWLHISSVQRDSKSLKVQIYWYLRKDCSRREDSENKGFKAGVCLASLSRIEVADVAGTEWTRGWVGDEIRVVLEGTPCSLKGLQKDISYYIERCWELLQSLDQSSNMIWLMFHYLSGYCINT